MAKKRPNIKLNRFHKDVKSSDSKTTDALSNNPMNFLSVMLFQLLFSFMIGFMVSFAYQSYTSFQIKGFNLAKLVGRSLEEGVLHDIPLQQTLVPKLKKLQKSKNFYILSNYVEN